MKYAKLDKSGVVIQVQPNIEEGFIKVDDNVCCGMVQTENGFIIPSPTEAELAEQARIAFKANRKILLDNLEITYNSVIYQADEVSQDRMARAIVAMETFPAETTINWVAKDNSIHSLTRADLQAMLGLAGIAQANIWTMQ